MSDEGLALCAERDLPSRHFQRSTPQRCGVDVRRSPAQEIFLFVAVAGLGRLVCITEDVSLAQVLAGVT